MEYYNPLRTYTPEEVAELMHTSAENVRTWIKTGVLSAIKTGKASVITTDELKRFQTAAQGLELSNLKYTIDSKKELLERKARM